MYQREKKREIERVSEYVNVYIFPLYLLPFVYSPTYIFFSNYVIRYQSSIRLQIDIVREDVCMYSYVGMRVLEHVVSLPCQPWVIRM